MKMRKELMLIGMLILIFVIVWIVQQTPKTTKEANVCGNKICEVSEDCNNCPSDCGCKPNEYCSSTGICRANVCGDGICSEQERQAATCCEDCGCPSDKVCNKFTQQCQEKTTITETQINNIVKTYLLNKSINGTVVQIVDTYYANQTVKQVTVDCRTQNLPYPCQIILFVDNSGNIVKEEKTT